MYLIILIILIFFLCEFFVERGQREGLRGKPYVTTNKFNSRRSDRY